MRAAHVIKRTSEHQRRWCPPADRHLSISIYQVTLTLTYRQQLSYQFVVFTARCTIVQSALLRLHCRLSVPQTVFLSVTLVDQDHTGWKSWKLIGRTISQNIFALRSSKAIHLFLWEHGEILGRLEVGWESGVLEHKSGNISETRTYCIKRIFLHRIRKHWNQRSQLLEIVKESLSLQRPSSALLTAWG